MKDALKGYLALASGLTEVTRQRALTAAKSLVAQGEATAGQVQSLADDLVAQSKSNREAVAALVKYEVDKALGRVGLASADEVGELTARVRSLETELRAAKKSASGHVAATPTKATPAKAPAKASAQKAAASPAKAPAKKAAASPGKAAAKPAKPAKSAARSPAQPAAAKPAAAKTGAPAKAPAPSTAAKATAQAEPAKTGAAQKDAALAPDKGPAGA